MFNVSCLKYSNDRLYKNIEFKNNKNDIAHKFTLFYLFDDNFQDLIGVVKTNYDVTNGKIITNNKTLSLFKRLNSFKTVKLNHYSIYDSVGVIVDETLDETQNIIYVELENGIFSEIQIVINQ